MMRHSSVTLLFASYVGAHSAVRHVVFDGVTYPAHSGPVDTAVNSKSIEWSSGVNNMMNQLWSYMPLGNVSDPGITCQPNPSPPQIKAFARAGSNITVQWSPIVRGHLGPVLTYLGRWESQNQKPQEVRFFKISEKSYNPQTGLWGNEDVMLANNSETMQIPSDIKPGIYILRTELLALHGNSPTMASGPLGGPQFYPHCFNVEISGTGQATPKGVTIPGAYEQKDFSVGLDVWGKPTEHTKYVAPGPPVYQGKYDTPVGSAVAVNETGAYPPELQKKYEDLTAGMETLSRAIITFVNAFDYGNSRKSTPGLQEIMRMMSNLGTEAGKVPKFLSDIESFKAEYAKLKGTSK